MQRTATSSRLCSDRIGVDQPEWSALTSMEDINAFIKKVGFPVLVRPSYVLSGAAMNVCSNQEELERFLQLAANVSKKHPVVVSQFIEHAKEVEMDAVAQNGEIVAYAISEHIEFAGVHSGDATIQFPPQKLYVETVRRIKRISRQIAKELNISGPFNIQFLARENDIKVIECNLRASRSFPFVSKVLKINFIELATKVMLGLPLKNLRRTCSTSTMLVSRRASSRSTVCRRLTLYWVLIWHLQVRWDVSATILHALY